MRFFTALVVLAIASVELGVFAAPATHPNPTGLVSKDAALKSKVARAVATKTTTRKMRRAAANDAVPVPVASEDSTAAAVKAATDPVMENDTVVFNQLAGDDDDDDNDNDDDDDNDNDNDDDDDDNDNDDDDDDDP
ncbi:hypothetical protein AURDEDRAFT_156093 [Auricularia subglabra TFB-10046 SS5]|nr:hypothetical protein AURDEDRAFT_156093 [Auricularia subglabra TFB-10046 SS5]